MESVIPQDVLDHLREVSDATGSLEGLLTTRRVADELDICENKARDMLRDLCRARKLRPRRIGLTDDQAWELGYLGGTGIRCYEWVDR